MFFLRAIENTLDNLPADDVLFFDDPLVETVHSRWTVAINEAKVDRMGNGIDLVMVLDEAARHVKGTLGSSFQEDNGETANVPCTPVFRLRCIEATTGA